MKESVFLRGVMVTAEKNIRIYYNKASVIIFGLLFPLFMFFAFYMGRKIDISVFFPGFLAMALFFTASSVGPLITPWEKQAGTYERLLSFPISVNTIILGDVLAGALFGLIITSVVMTVAVLFLEVAINTLILLGVAIVLGIFCFASLGVLLASPSVRSPSHIMMFSSLIRFPLIFISGVFIPLTELQGVGLILSYISPLTYLVDMFNAGLTGTSAFPVVVDILALILFTCVFLLIASKFHKRNLTKGL
ncbi:MAG: ABC transporter permease [Thermoplasmata archaeon]|nr:ABC transporter permease [Thermoplasmata archaeon]